jgi:dTDP-4-amino-4,6-dideoxygalactose transaminase
VGPEAGASRDEIVEALAAQNVLARRYFWPGCHRMKPYSDLFPWAESQLPNTVTVAARTVVLPTGMQVSEADIAVIAGIIRQRCGA